MKYRFRKGFRTAGLSAQAVGSFFEQVRKAHGAIEPATVVEVARNPKSLLHGYFTWDDKKAAEAHRLNEARYLIRSVEVYVTFPHRPDPIPTRAFVSVGTQGGDAEGQRFTSVHAVLADPDSRAQLLAKAWAELAAFRIKYARLEELADVFDAIEARQPA